MNINSDRSNSNIPAGNKRKSRQERSEEQIAEINEQLLPYEVSLRSYEYEKQKVEIWKGICSILFVFFYVVCIPMIYVLYNQFSLTFMFGLLCILILTFPFWTIWLETRFIRGYKYIVSTFLGIPYDYDEAVKENVW